MPISTWTWPLETALNLTATASGIDSAHLRRRAAQLMTRIGGTNAFGPDAQSRQRKRLERLRLETTFRRLPETAAFQAMREVVGELAAAEAIEPEAVPLILLWAGGYPANVRTVASMPRPRGVLATEMPDIFASRNGSEWRDQVACDLARLQMDGYVVLASIAVHERKNSQEEWQAEQYFGPGHAQDADDLDDQMHCLPKVMVGDSLATFYPGLAAGAVAQPQLVIAGSIDPRTPMLCPRVAAALGWRVDPRHALTYLDEGGRFVAGTLSWRDGGNPTRTMDRAVTRHGHVLVVRQDRAEDIRPYRALEQLTRAWRISRERQGGEPAISSASRREPL